ncbi:CvpA family protein [Hyphobacterium indicum]|jgi:membrane protein required for colicin V production|uniref:CvpA family protein n=1 Tax=Hyphobacterium indicum TaxID=2162714 RepID=UPI000D64B7D5|nr:CvpA family protein [Hyphobacterium indicum]MBI1236825.1 CvpA family protein [Alphaproteobacteria bacterium]
MGGLTPVDGAILLFIGASAYHALVRGFVSEALSMTAAIVAAIAALWSRPLFVTLADDFVPSGWLANLVTLAVIFALVFMAVSFLTAPMRANVKRGDDVGFLDRTLGFFFGIVRALLALGFFLIISSLANQGQPPSQLTDARLYPLVNTSARLLQSLAPGDSHIGRTEAISPAETPAERAYDERDRNRLDELIGTASEDDDG